MPATDRKRVVRLLLGIALSIGALWLAFRGVGLSEVVDVLRDVSWPWIVAMLALKASVLVIKDLRWRRELEAMAPGPYAGTFRAIGLGYFGNIVLPFKLGEVLRVGLLKRRNPQVAIGDALATIAAERAIDGAVLALMVGAVLHTAEVPGWVYTGTIILLVAMLGVIAVSMLSPVHRWILRLLPDKGLPGWARRVVIALARGTAVVREPSAFGLVVIYTSIAWLGEATVFYCAVRALDLPLSYASSLVVTLLMSVGLLIPSAPGQIGTHQALTVLFLEPFGIDKGTAISLSLVLQAVALTTLGGIGGYVLIREAGAKDLVKETEDHRVRESGS